MPALTVSLLKALDMATEAAAASANVTSPSQPKKKKPGLSPRVQELKKQRELNSEELSALQGSGQCELVTSESRFEQTVANMVRDFRDPQREED